jgi:serine/threonine-protein kinase
VLGRSGEVDEAVRVLREVLEEHPTMDGIRRLLAQQLIRQGDTQAAREQLSERVREAADADHDIAYWLGTAHAMLGERDEALHWLDRAIDLGNENRTWFESDPNWEALREDPRFVALMRRIEAAQIQAQPREISLTEAGEGGSSTHPEAYEEYLKGRDASGRFIYHTLARVDSEEAVVHFKRAAELDANFALAWAALGGAYANRVIKVIGGPEDYERAAEALERALALKPGLLEARLHMVFVEMGRGNKARARELADKLVRENPTDVGAQFAYATVARLDGRYQDALDAYGRMLKINPAERVVVSYNRARVFLYQHRHDDAEAELNLGAQMEPNHPFVKSFKAIICAYRGDLEGAMRTMTEVLRRNPDMDGVRPLYAQFLIQWGDLDRARAELTEGALRVARANFDVAFWVASAYAMLGDADPAFEWLGRAIDVGNENRRWFESDPHWEPLREDPRFAALMSRIGHPEERANEARQQ